MSGNRTPFENSPVEQWWIYTIYRISKKNQQTRTNPIIQVKQSLIIWLHCIHESTSLKVSRPKSQRGHPRPLVSTGNGEISPNHHVVASQTDISMGRLYIYLHEWLICMVNVGKSKYTIHGCHGKKNSQV